MYRLKNNNGFAALELLLIVAVLAVIGVVGFFVFKQADNFTALAATSVSPKGCATDSTNSSQKVTAFINAYQKGQKSELTSYLVCGKPPIWTDTFLEFDASVNAHKLTVAQYQYMDGQPRGNPNHPSCTIQVVNKNTANLNCSKGKDLFNLYS